MSTAGEEIVEGFDAVASADDGRENFGAAESHGGEIGVVVIVFDEKDGLPAKGHEEAPRVKKKVAARTRST